MKKKVLVIVSIITSILLIAGGIFAYFYFRPPTQAEIEQYEKIVEQGDIFLSAKEYSEAILKYNESIKIVHTDHDAYSKIVDIYLTKNDFDSAIAVADKAQNSLSTSDSSLIYASIAQKYYNNSDFYNANINYEIAASLNSNSTVNLGLAKSNVLNEKIDRAETLLKKTFDDSTSDEATLLYAYIVGSEDNTKAVNILDDYTVINEEWNGYFDEYMSVLTSLNEDQIFNKAKLGRIYINNGYPTLAISILEPKVEELAQYVDGLYILGKAYLDSGDYDKAVETLLQSVSLLGYEDQKYWMLGRTYFYQDDLVNSITYYDRAVGYSGDDLEEELVKEYLHILISSNQTTKSQEVYSNIVKDVKEDWLYLIGVELYYNAQNNAKLNYYLGKLSEMDLQDNEKKEYLFWDIKQSLDNGEIEGLDSTLEILLSLDRFNPQYYWLKGLYDLEGGDKISAKNNFENALEYDLEGNISTEVEELLAQVE
ncbi:hypothetical protein K8R14_00835 [bacterium]|nr:hypothetical protein [bacterium]